MASLLFALLYLGISSVQASTYVTLPDGTKLQGIKEGNIVVFKGIPFAQPPIGNLRWAPPKKWINPNPENVVDATKFGHACTQWMWGDDGLFGDTSEDCLNLNVYVNLNYSLSIDTKLPVGIFVHGGSYITGTSFLPLYQGQNMIEFMEGKAILVTTNYRLNIFGFLGAEELKGQDNESHSTGNYGIQDQRLAFEWVQTNIGAFGGDAGRVTIFGESAGAGSMSNHLTMKKSWRYFHSVILESGAFSAWVTTSMSCAQSNYDMLLKYTRCEDVTCLLGKSDEEILHASMALYLTSCPWAPVADNVEIATHPWIALSNGDVADVPILHGSNADEGALFTVFDHQGNADDLKKYWTQKGYTQDEQITLTSLYITDKIYPVNKLNNSVYWWAAQRSYGDNFMSCPSEYTSQQLGKLQQTHKRESNTYMYHFEHTARNISLVRHVSELEFVFHQNGLLRHPEDRLMADVLTSYWGNFWANKDPNIQSIGKSHIPLWLPYTASHDNLLAIVDYNNATMKSNVKLLECEFQIARLDSQIRTKFA